MTGMGGRTEQSPKRAGEPGRVTAPAHCRWVDVIGRNRAQLERVQTQLALPARLVPLSLAEHLRPAAVRVRPAWFLVTHFTAPSPRGVFTRRPLYVWLGEHAIVTITPWARQTVLETTGELEETRDDLLCRVVEAAVSSHEEVSRHLNEAFFAKDRGESPRAWHQKERRITVFGQLLDHQLDLLRAVGGSAKMRQLRRQLAALAQIAHYADRKLRQSGCCPLCTHHAALGQRRGH